MQRSERTTIIMLFSIFFIMLVFGTSVVETVMDALLKEGLFNATMKRIMEQIGEKMVGPTNVNCADQKGSPIIVDCLPCYSFCNSTLLALEKRHQDELEAVQNSIGSKVESLELGWSEEFRRFTNASLEAIEEHDGQSDRNLTLHQFEELARLVRRILSSSTKCPDELPVKSLQLETFQVEQERQFEEIKGLVQQYRMPSLRGMCHQGLQLLEKRHAEEIGAIQKSLKEKEEECHTDRRLLDRCNAATHRWGRELNLESVKSRKIKMQLNKMRKKLERSKLVRTRLLEKISKLKDRIKKRAS